MQLNFTEAILNATDLIMRDNSSTILFGLGVNDDRGLQGTTKNLFKIFGEERVFDVPIAEDALMGFAVGVAMSGVMPIFNHARMDFLLLTFNQLFNVATKYSYMFNGMVKVPMIVRCLVGKGWGPQHSQVLTSLLASFPGISVVCPASPFEAKGLLIEASTKDYPVIFVEDFQLYSKKEEVPEERYQIKFNEINILSKGSDLTLITISSASIVVEEFLKKNDNLKIDAICLRTVTDIDYGLIEESVRKTGKLFFVQNAWLEFGLGANIVRELLLRKVQFKYSEIGFPFVPTPYSPPMENEYYVNESKLSAKINNFLLNAI
jgi:pyruvate/2-oxoglutarate/acetoin dehydrogenase E1 component